MAGIVILISSLKAVCNLIALYASWWLSVDWKVMRFSDTVRWMPFKIGLWFEVDLCVANAVYSFF